MLLLAHPLVRGAFGVSGASASCPVRRLAIVAGLLAAGVWLGACAAPPAQQAAPSASVPESVFVDPGSALLLEERPAAPGEQQAGWTLADLIGAYGKILDERVVAEGESLKALESVRVDFGRELTIPPESVHTFVESLLSQHGFVFTRSLDGSRADVRLLKLAESDWIRSACLPVPAQGIERFRRHPALLVSTVVELSNIDVEELAKVLRHEHKVTGERFTLLKGTHFLQIFGTGTCVANRVETLRESNAVEGASFALAEEGG